MNDDLCLAFRTIVNHCRAHYRVHADCKGCEMTDWCEDRSGFPKEWKRYIEESKGKTK